MSTQLREKEVRADGSVALTPVDLTRSPGQFGVVGQTKRVVRTSGDVSVSVTVFTDVPDMSLDVTLAASAKLLISAIVYGKAPLAGDLRVTILVDGVNLGGAGGLSLVSGPITGFLAWSCLNINGLTDLLAAGLHTIKLQAKVSIGTGVLAGDDTSSVPMVLSVIVLEGDLA